MKFLADLSVSNILPLKVDKIIRKNRKRTNELMSFHKVFKRLLLISLLHYRTGQKLRFVLYNNVTKLKI